MKKIILSLSVALLVPMTSAHALKISFDGPVCIALFNLLSQSGVGVLRVGSGANILVTNVACTSIQDQSANVCVVHRGDREIRIDREKASDLITVLLNIPMVAPNAQDPSTLNLVAINCNASFKDGEGNVECEFRK